MCVCVSPCVCVCVSIMHVSVLIVAVWGIICSCVWMYAAVLYCVLVVVFMSLGSMHLVPLLMSVYQLVSQ